MFYDNVFLFILEAVNFFPECYEGELKQEYTCECPVTDRHQIITTAYDRSNPEFICPMSSCENFPCFGTLEKLNAHLRRHKDLLDQFVPKSPAPNIETSYDSVLQLHSPSVSPSTVLASNDELSETPFTLSSLPISSIDNLKSFPDSETLMSPEQTDSPNISPLPFTTFSYSDSYFRRDNMFIPIAPVQKVSTSYVPPNYCVSTVQNPTESINLPNLHVPLVSPIEEFPSYSNLIKDIRSTSNSTLPILPVSSPKQKRVYPEVLVYVIFVGTYLLVKGMFPYMYDTNMVLFNGPEYSGFVECVIKCMIFNMI